MILSVAHNKNNTNNTNNNNNNTINNSKNNKVFMAHLESQWAYIS